MFPSAIFLTFLFLLFPTATHTCSFSNEPNSSKTHHCPPFSSTPPFPFSSSPGCGHPSFQLNCSSPHSLISINNLSFSILSYKSNSSSILLSPLNPLNNNNNNNTCPYSSIPNKPINLSNTPFTLSDELCSRLSFLQPCPPPNLPNCTHCSWQCKIIKNPTEIFTNCRSMHHSVSDSEPTCQSDVLTYLNEILTFGIELQWDEALTQDTYFTNCTQCLNQKGFCGYNSSDPNKHFICFHSKETISPPWIHKMKLNKIAVFAVIIAFTSLLLFITVTISILRSRSLNSQSVSEDPTTAFLHNHHSANLFPPVFTYDELNSSTNNFDPNRKLGDGGFGSVYLGNLRDGKLAAVKHLHRQNQNHTSAFSSKSFCNEILILSSINHPNLVKLHGYCSDPRGLILVYDYVPNGTLAEHIHGVKSKRNGYKLTWQTRLDIALQTALAMEYLHFEVKPAIVHRDITSSNIFVERDMRIKVGDFGLSRLLILQETNQTTSSEGFVWTGPQGTPGYLDPDYHRSFRLTEKSDVYSFGVVLLELITGLKAVDYCRDKREMALADMVVSRIHTGQLREVKKATSVSVGETHLLIVASLYHPDYPIEKIDDSQKLKSSNINSMEEFNEDILFEDTDSNNTIYTVQNDNLRQRSTPSLKSLCEKAAAECMLEPRNALQLLEIADSLGADDLKKYCEDIVMRNLDYIFSVSTHAVATASLDILASLEGLLDQRSSEAWSYRRLPTPTATLPVIIDSEEDNNEIECQRIYDKPMKISALKLEKAQRSDSFLQPKDDPDSEISKVVRAIRKKLQQIEMLETKQSKGHLLDDQQMAKLQSKLALESSLAELGVPVETSQNKESSSIQPEGKGSKKGKSSKKQRRKSGNKSSVEQTDIESVYSKPEMIPESVDLLDKPSPNSKVEEDICKHSTAVPGEKDLGFVVQKKDASELLKGKGQSPKVSRKKNKKGGLSMFLSGALDEVPEEVAPPPPTPKNDGPAWGGAKFGKGSSSLREIQDEQSKIIGNKPPGVKDKVEDLSDFGSSGKIKLSSFLYSSPIPVAATRSPQASDGDKNTPPWAASGTPPQPFKLSLRDIQMQQVKKQAQALSSSPKTKTAGFTIATGQGSPSEATGMNRWFKPEVDTPSSIRSIQIEEKAMKDLRRFYTSVKIVKKQC